MMPTPTSGLSLHALSLGLIPTCSEVSSPQINIVQGSLELNGPHTTPIYAPWYFCPHKQGFWPHSPPCKSAQIVLWLSSEVSIPWYPTWLSFRQDIALWSNMGQLIPYSLWFFINVFFLLGHPGLPVLVSSANHGKPPAQNALLSPVMDSFHALERCIFRFCPLWNWSYHIGNGVPHLSSRVFWGQ